MTDVSQFSTLAAALEVSRVAAAVKKAEDFHSRAQVCEDRAEWTSDRWVKHQFQECAEQWRRLAEEAERRA